MSATTIRWNEYRDQVRTIAREAHDKIEAVMAAARESGRFPPDHVTDVGDADNAAVVRAERAAYQGWLLMREVGEHLTLRMTAEESADFGDHS